MPSKGPGKALSVRERTRGGFRESRESQTRSCLAGFYRPGTSSSGHEYAPGFASLRGEFDRTHGTAGLALANKNPHRTRDSGRRFGAPGKLNCSCGVWYGKEQCQQFSARVCFRYLSAASTVYCDGSKPTLRACPITVTVYYGCDHIA